MPFNLTDFLEAVDQPEWLTHNSAWIYHLPMVPVFIRTLLPRTFVELGTYRGDSYMGFCQAVQKIGSGTRCTAVDTWQGDAHAGHYGPGIYLELKKQHDTRYTAFSTLLKTDFDSAATQFAANSIDLLHIDGLHTYEAVKHDFETWLPKMTDRGVVLFHDTAVFERDFGVHKLWAEISTDRPHFNIPYGCGLGILAVGKNVPVPFLEFLHELNTNHKQILPQFIALGRRNELLRHVMVLSAAIHHCQDMANQWRTLTAQPIRNATPDNNRAFNDPAGFSSQTVKDIAQLTSDTIGLMTEVTELRKKAKAPPPLAAV